MWASKQNQDQIPSFPPFTPLGRFSKISLFVGIMFSRFSLCCYNSRPVFSCFCLAEFVVIGFGLFFVFSEKQPPDKKIRNFKKTVAKPASLVTRRLSSASSRDPAIPVMDALSYRWLSSFFARWQVRLDCGMLKGCPLHFQICLLLSRKPTKFLNTWRLGRDVYMWARMINYKGQHYLLDPTFPACVSNLYACAFFLCTVLSMIPKRHSR